MQQEALGIWPHQNDHSMRDGIFVDFIHHCIPNTLDDAWPMWVLKKILWNE